PPFAFPMSSTAEYNNLWGAPNAAQTANDPFSPDTINPQVPYLGQYMQLPNSFFSNNPDTRLPAPDVNSFTLPDGSLLPSSGTHPEGWVPNPTVLDPSVVPPQPIQYMGQYAAGVNQRDAMQMPQYVPETLQWPDQTSPKFSNVNPADAMQSQLGNIINTSYNG